MASPSSAPTASALLADGADHVQVAHALAAIRAAAASVAAAVPATLGRFLATPP